VVPSEPGPTPDYTLNEFLSRAKSSYARHVTLDVLKELSAGVTSTEGDVGALRSRIEEALRLAS
jgi:hypothetical protein